MHQMNVKRLDLNLLVVLEAIARSGSVTGAADLLVLSQPAVSHALSRLRRQIGDPIYVRGRGRLIATPRGEVLIQQARSLISAAYEALAPQDFDPATTNQPFRLATSDYSSIVLVPHLLSTFMAKAPHARFEMMTAGGSTLDSLEMGEADCSYWGTDPPGYPFEHCELFRERMVLVVRSRNPLLSGGERETIGIEEYCSQPHIVVSLGDPGRSRIEAELTARGLKRRIALVAHSFAAALVALRENDLVAALPQRLVAQARDPDLRAFPLPFEAQDYPYFLIWHSRLNAHEPARWFRTLVQNSANITTSDGLA